MFCYTTIPIDLGWGFLLTVEETRERMKSREPYMSFERFDEKYEDAREQARQYFGDAEIRQGCEPHVFLIPSPAMNAERMMLGFIWKYEADGVTFVASELPLDEPIFSKRYTPLRKLPKCYSQSKRGSEVSRQE